MSTAECSASEHIKYPEGGHILSKPFEVTSLNKGVDVLNPEENVSLDLIALAVDYMVRVVSGEPAEVVFRFPLFLARRIGGDAFTFGVQHLIDNVNGLDNRSIINAVKLSGVHSLISPERYQHIDEINPDEATIHNVRVMVGRLHRFFDDRGVKLPMPDTLWDFNVSESGLTEAQTLQLLVRWRLGIRSHYAWWLWRFKYLGIYNPRLDEVYQISVDDIPEDVIAEVDRDVIGYAE